MYLGNGQIVEAQQSGVPVHTRPVSYDGGETHLSNPGPIEAPVPAVQLTRNAASEIQAISDDATTVTRGDGEGHGDVDPHRTGLVVAGKGPVMPSPLRQSTPRSRGVERSSAGGGAPVAPREHRFAPGQRRSEGEAPAAACDNQTGGIAGDPHR